VEPEVEGPGAAQCPRPLRRAGGCICSGSLSPPRRPLWKGGGRKRTNRRFFSGSRARCSSPSRGVGRRRDRLSSRFRSTSPSGRDGKNPSLRVRTMTVEKQRTAGLEEPMIARRRDGSRGGRRSPLRRSRSTSKGSLSLPCRSPRARSPFSSNADLLGLSNSTAPSWESGTAGTTEARRPKKPSPARRRGRKRFWKPQSPPRNESAPAAGAGPLRRGAADKRAKRKRRLSTTALLAASSSFPRGFAARGTARIPGEERVARGAREAFRLELEEKLAREVQEAVECTLLE